MSYSEELAGILDETKSAFPQTDPNINILLGKTIFKNHKWHKAVVLCRDRAGRLQLRFYGWQRYKNSDIWKVRQKFNISTGLLFNLCGLLEKINYVFEKRAQQQHLEELQQQKLKEQLRAHPFFHEKDYP